MSTENRNIRQYPWVKKLRPLLPYGILANLRQWVRRSTHEADFEIFDWLSDAPGMVLDIGASRGQSALSVLRRTKRMRVFSIEPNRKHRWSLWLIGLLHPFRFRFRLVAAGDQFTSATLHVPGRRASGLSAQGSLDPAEFEKDYVVERLAASGFDATDNQAYRLLQVQVLPLDSLGLLPDLVKMDVEGFEQQALAGLEETLKLQHPAMLIEINNHQRWMPFLGSLGYAFYYYDEASRTLKSFDDNFEILNILCLSGQSKSVISRTLLNKVMT